MPPSTIPQDILDELQKRGLTLHDSGDVQFLLDEQQRQSALILANQVEEAADPLLNPDAFHKVPKTKNGEVGVFGNVSVVVVEGVPFALLEELGKGGSARAKVAQNLKTGEWMAAKITLYDPDEMKVDNKYPRQPSNVYKILPTLDTPQKREAFWRERIIQERDMTVAYYAKPDGTEGLGTDRVKGAIREVSIGEKKYLKSYLFMPLGDKKTLYDKINEETFDETQAADITRNLLNDLIRLRQKNIVHNDIKPSNIVFGEKGAHLMDFSEAHFLQNAAAVISGISPRHASPERFLDSGSAAAKTFSSDMYSMGLVLAELYGITLPYPQARILGSNGEIFNEHPVIPNVKISLQKKEQYLTLISAMTEADPKNRPSPELVLAAFNKIQANESISDFFIFGSPLQVRDRILSNAILEQIRTLFDVYGKELLDLTETLKFTKDPGSDFLYATLESRVGRPIHVRVFQGQPPILHRERDIINNRFDVLQKAIVKYAEETAIEYIGSSLEIEQKNIEARLHTCYQHGRQDSAAYLKAADLILNEYRQKMGSDFQKRLNNTATFHLAEIQQIEAQLSTESEPIVVNVYSAEPNNLQVAWIIDCLAPNQRKQGTIDYHMTSQALIFDENGMRLPHFKPSSIGNINGLLPMHVRDVQQRQMQARKFITDEIVCVEDTFERLQLEVLAAHDQRLATSKTDSLAIQPKRKLILSLFSPTYGFDSDRQQLQETQAAVAQVQTELASNDWAENEKSRIIVALQNEQRVASAIALIGKQWRLQEVTPTQKLKINSFLDVKMPIDTAIAQIKKEFKLSNLSPEEELQFKTSFEKLRTNVGLDHSVQSVARQLNNVVQIAHVNFGVDRKRDNTIAKWIWGTQEKVNETGLEKQLLSWFFEKYPMLAHSGKADFKDPQKITMNAVLNDWKKGHDSNIATYMRANNSPPDNMALNCFAGLLHALDDKRSNSKANNYLRPIFVALLAESLGVELHLLASQDSDKSKVFFSLLNEAKAVLAEVLTKKSYPGNFENFSLSNAEDFNTFVNLFWKGAGVALKFGAGFDAAMQNPAAAKVFAELDSVLPIKQMEASAKKAAVAWRSMVPLIKQTAGGVVGAVANSSGAVLVRSPSAAAPSPGTVSLNAEGTMLNTGLNPFSTHPEPVADVSPVIAAESVLETSNVSTPTTLSFDSIVGSSSNDDDSDNENDVTDIARARMTARPNPLVVSTATEEGPNVSSIPAPPVMSIEPSINAPLPAVLSTVSASGLIIQPELKLQDMVVVMEAALHGVPHAGGPWTHAPMSNHECKFINVKGDLHIQQSGVSALDFSIIPKSDLLAEDAKMKLDDQALILARVMIAAWEKMNRLSFSIDNLSSSELMAPLVKALANETKDRNTLLALQTSITQVSTKDGQTVWLKDSPELIRHFVKNKPHFALD